jgi:hypothetical protein
VPLRVTRSLTMAMVFYPSGLLDWVLTAIDAPVGRVGKQVGSGTDVLWRTLHGKRQRRRQALAIRTEQVGVTLDPLTLTLTVAG